MNDEVPYYIPDVVEPPKPRNGFEQRFSGIAPPADTGWGWVKPVVAVVAGVVVLSTVTDLVRAIKE